MPKKSTKKLPRLFGRPYLRQTLKEFDSADEHAEKIIVYAFFLVLVVIGFVFALLLFGVI